MDRYVREQTAGRLGRFAFELRRSARSGSADQIHDLRVSIRRFTQCLRVFGGFFPRKENRKIRRRLRRVMDLAAAVRNRDIAIELIRKAGLRAGSAFEQRLSLDRKLAARRLATALKGLSRREFSSRWRSRLEL
jgi:CHAD domain-containing protein